MQLATETKKRKKKGLPVEIHCFILQQVLFGSIEAVMYVYKSWHRDNRSKAQDCGSGIMNPVYSHA